MGISTNYFDQIRWRIRPWKSLWMWCSLRALTRTIWSQLMFGKQKVYFSLKGELGAHLYPEGIAGTPAMVVSSRILQKNFHNNHYIWATGVYEALRWFGYIFNETPEIGRHCAHTLLFFVCLLFFFSTLYKHWELTLWGKSRRGNKCSCPCYLYVLRTVKP